MTKHLWSLVVLGACFSPEPLPGISCDDGACPSGMTCSPFTETCELTETSAALIGECRGDGLLVCPEQALASLDILEPMTIDTDDECLPSRGDDVCAIASRTIRISGQGSLRAIGSRPLALIALDSITIDGVLDVASHGDELGAGADPDSCIDPDDAEAGGGGTGGSFGGHGGLGGLLDGVGVSPSAAGPTVGGAFRGGCGGGDGTSGDGGAGGGAVYLAAATIEIAGSINASGASGEASDEENEGGGGGGSGGMIVLDAATIVVSGQVFANGGAGGGGDNDSTPPADSPQAMLAAAGGLDTGDTTGHGGDGAAGTALDGKDGADGADGGGGGGGAAGVIRVLPLRALAGTWSPPIR